MLAAVAAACAACGSGAGLHIEDGGRTVHVGPVTAPTAPPRPQTSARPSPACTWAARRRSPTTRARCGAPCTPARAWSARSSRSTSPRAGGWGRPVPLPPAGRPYLLAVGPDGVWLAAGVRLWRDRPRHRPGRGDDAACPAPATALEDSGGSVWATVTPTGGGRLVRLDPVTGRDRRRGAGRALAERAHRRRRLGVGDRQRRPVDPALLASPRARCAAPATWPPALARARADPDHRLQRLRVGVRARPRAAHQPVDRPRAGHDDRRLRPGRDDRRGQRRHLGDHPHPRPRPRGRAPARRATGLAAGRRIVVGGRPTAIVTDGRAAWVLDSGSDRLVRVFPG